MLRLFIRDENAVNIEIGYILNLVVLMIVTGTITGAFYLRAEDSSRQSMRVGFTDLGSQIARDITNMYITSENSYDINLTAARSIPLTIGGKGYRIMIDATEGDGMASVRINEAGFLGYETRTKINSMDKTVNASGVVYSGSGEININMTKNNSGTWVNIN